MRARNVLAALAAATLLAACGGDAAPDQPVARAEGGSTLAEVCGQRLVLQTDWFPQPEHGGAYHLIGPDGTVDAKRGTYTGEISTTGVELEIRAGGPYIGSEQVSAQMYTDDEIFMGYVNIDEAVKLSATLPTVAVLAPLDKSPQILMWNPEVWDFSSFADIGASGAKVLHFEGSTFVDYLVGEGLLRPEQLDASYDGSPSRFVAEGDVVQQGYATSEPYKYEHDIPEWSRPVDFLLVHESGYETYPQNIALRREDVEAHRECLEVLVPMMQQAQVDYLQQPGPVNEALVAMVEQLNSFWTLTTPATADSVAKMRELDVVANGTDGVMGSFDLARVQRTIDTLVDIYTEQNIRSVTPGVEADDIVTNAFLDEAIALP